MVQIVWVKPLETNDSTQKWNFSASKPLPFSFKSKETWPEIVLERVNTKTKQKRIKSPLFWKLRLGPLHLLTRYHPSCGHILFSGTLGDCLLGTLLLDQTVT